MTKIRRSMRLEPVLSTRCNALASEKQMTFSEWVRTILRREVGLAKQNGRAR